MNFKEIASGFFSRVFGSDEQSRLMRMLTKDLRRNRRLLRANYKAELAKRLKSWTFNKHLRELRAKKPQTPMEKFVMFSLELDAIRRAP